MATRTLPRTNYAYVPIGGQEPILLPCAASATGVEVEWDIAPVPPDGGLPADHVIVSRPLAGPPSS